MSNSVTVSGISATTSETQLREFFSFCGNIKSLDLHKNEESTAVIHFENSAAVKTAVMLNGGVLDNATLTVTADIPPQHEAETAQTREGETIEQHEKPRAGIAAEYLAKGYILSDHILQRSIEIDAKQGISKRFLDYMQSLDTSIGAKTLGPDKTISQKVQETVKSAAEQAKTVDEKKGLTKTANDYYVKAISSPLGKKVHDFYTSTSKQVQDIHEEARRIAEAQRAPTTSTS